MADFMSRPSAVHIRDCFPGITSWTESFSGCCEKEYKVYDDIYPLFIPRHIVPSFPPMQYKRASTAATPQEDRLLVIDGTESHFPILGSSLSTLDW